METRVVRIDGEHPETDVVAEGARVLAAGELVAFPTETVYGLGAHALDPAALARVFAAKGRPTTHPLIAHVLGVDDARALALAGGWPERASRLARAFWPGGLTLVVPRGAGVPAALTGGADSVAVRAPAHPVARALIAALGAPIAAPSANRYRTLSPTRAEHVVKSLGGRIALVLDGGPCGHGIESTVVDVRGARARLLRPGAIDVGRLREIEPDIEIGYAAAPDEGATRASPGMDVVHYAPRAPLVLARGDGAIAAAIVERRRVAVAAGGAASGTAGGGARTVALGLLLRGGAARLASPPLGAPDVVGRVLADDPVAYARDLFAALHTLDDVPVAAIVVEAPPPADDRWAAVEDRLSRAAAAASSGA